MKVLGIISTAALLVLLGAAVPAFAQEEHHEDGAKPAQHEEKAKPAEKQEQAKPQRQEQQAKPAKQEQARPEKQQQQARPQKQEQQAKTQEENQQKHTQQQAKTQEQNQRHTQQQADQQRQHENQRQVKTQQNEEKNQQHQQQADNHEQRSQGQYARNGQKDRYGHEYNESRFGPEHHTRFEENGGRYYEGRREYSYGGYWFYAGSYPAWFYQQDVYFIMGADGLWYAVAVDNPSLTFQVNIG